MCPNHFPEKPEGHLVGQLRTGAWETLGKAGGMVWDSVGWAGITLRV